MGKTDVNKAPGAGLDPCQDKLAVRFCVLGLCRIARDVLVDDRVGLVRMAGLSHGQIAKQLTCVGIGRGLRRDFVEPLRVPCNL